MKAWRFFVLALALALLALSSRSAAVSTPPNDVLPIAAREGAVASPDGKVVYAASCDQADVQAAIDAASDGDTVLIPAGSCTWTTTMVIDPMPAITIRGAGIDETIITNAVPRTGWLDTLLWIESAAGRPFRITGLTFRGTVEVSGDSDHGTIRLGGTCENWRIDHVKFDHLHSRGVRLSGYAFGVIDHCDFITNNWTQFIYIDHSGWGGQSYGDGSWNSPLSLGTAEAVYIEDNVFTWDGGPTPIGPIDCCGGGRFVFRHNQVNNTRLGSNHGTESTGRYRSCFSYEVYSNTATRTDTPSVWTLFFIRGGTGVVFDNTASGNFDTLAHVANYRDYHAFTPWGACDGTSPYDLNDGVTYESGTHTGGDGATTLTCSGRAWATDQWVGYSLHNTTKGRSSVIVANTQDTISVVPDQYSDPLTWDAGDRFTILRAYPCLDQVGRSTGGLLSGWDPPLPQQWPAQTLEPLYEWNNTINGQDADIVSDSPHVVEGRDYYNDTPRPGYTPYVYPHPLTRELVLSGTPGDEAIFLNWQVRILLPLTTTWRIDYYTHTAGVFTATDPLSGTRSFVLTEHVFNYHWYTVTLHAMLGETSWLSDTVRVMPTDIFVYLPLLMKGATR